MRESLLLPACVLFFLSLVSGVTSPISHFFGIWLGGDCVVWLFFGWTTEFLLLSLALSFMEVAPFEPSEENNLRL